MIQDARSSARYNYELEELEKAIPSIEARKTVEAMRTIGKIGKSCE